METGRKCEFDIAKAIAIYLVVVGHVRNNVLYDVGGGIWFFHMPVFFFISGYFAEKSLCRYSMQEFCKKKIMTLIVPFFLWSLISIMLNSFLSIAKNSFTFTFFWEEMQSIFIYARSVWFLIILFITSIFYMIVRRIFNNKFLFIYGLALWAAVSCLLPDDVLRLYKFKWLFPFFFAGAMVKRANKESKKINIFCVLAGNVIFYTMATFLYKTKIFVDYTTYSYESIEDIAGGILCYAVSFIGIWAVLEVAGYLKKIRIVERILSVIGQYSIDIYVIHMFLIKIVFFMPTMLQENKIWGNIYIYFYSLFVVVFIVTICKLVLDKIVLYKVSVGKYVYTINYKIDFKKCRRL